VSDDFLHGENLRSLIGDDGACALFPFSRLHFGDAGLLVLSWWC
jgi:hypothetical protein